eukprot:9381035-Pyramimonas_sp.AAC.1
MMWPSLQAKVRQDGHVHPRRRAASTHEEAGPIRADCESSCSSRICCRFQASGMVVDRPGWPHTCSAQAAIGADVRAGLSPAPRGPACPGDPGA